MGGSPARELRPAPRGPRRTAAAEPASEDSTVQAQQWSRVRPETISVASFSLLKKCPFRIRPFLCKMGH